jgi:hypothetical protein
MRPPRAVRARLAVPLTVALAATALGTAATGGCGSSSGGSSPADASEDYSVTPVEAGEDAPSAMDVDAGAPLVVPRVFVVNASPDAPPLRFCLAVASADGGSAVVVGGGLTATPDQATFGFPLPGVYPGFGGPFDDHGLDLDTLSFAVFALDATNPIVAANTAATGIDGGTDASLEAPCEALIGNDGLGASSDAGGVLQPGRDFWNLGTIPAGSLGHGTTWLAAVTGCLPGEVNAATLCPAGYDPTAGDLHLLTWSLDTVTPVDAGVLGAQFAQASGEWDNFARIAGGITSAGFLIPGDGGGASASDGGLEASVDGAADASTEAAAADAGSSSSPWASLVQVPIASDAGFGALQPAALALVPGLALDGSTAFFAQITAAGGPIAPTPLGWPLPAVQALSWPAAVPEAGVLRDGAGFVFVLVGNPAVTAVYVNPIDGGPAGVDAGGVFNGHAPHVLAFPVANP